MVWVEAWMRRARSDRSRRGSLWGSPESDRGAVTVSVGTGSGIKKVELARIGTAHGAHIPDVALGDVIALRHAACRRIRIPQDAPLGRILVRRNGDVLRSSTVG